MMPRWAYFLTAIMFSINILFIGFGLVDVNSSPLSNNNMSTLNQSINDYDTDTRIDSSVDTSTTSTVGDDSDSTVKFGLSEIVSLGDTFKNLLLNLVLGYTTIFWILNMPPILVYLFSSIIGIAMIMVILDVLISIVSAIRSLRVF